MLYSEKVEKCFLWKATITSLRPLFSDHFIKEVKRINDLLPKNDKENFGPAETQMEQFIMTFGTHYMHYTELGCALRTEQRYTSRSTSDAESNDRERCSSKSVEACIGASYSGMYF